MGPSQLAVERCGFALEPPLIPIDHLFKQQSANIRSSPVAAAQVPGGGVGTPPDHCLPGGPMLFAADIFWKIIALASSTASGGPLTVTCRFLAVLIWDLFKPQTRSSHHIHANAALSCTCQK